MKPDLVIFDCDGVLIDSEIIACSADAIELTNIGYSISTQEVVRRFSGVPSVDMYAEIEADLGTALPHDFEQRVSQRIADEYSTNLAAIPGVRETIPNLPVPYCVASSSKPDKLSLGLQQTNLLELFAPNVFSTSLVARGKPAPDIFLYSAEQFSVSPDKCVVIEDSVAGVTAARDARMRVLGFVGGSHCGPDHERKLLEAGAEAVFREFPLLLNEISKLSAGTQLP